MMMETLSPEKPKVGIARKVEKWFVHHKKKGLWGPLKFRFGHMTPTKTAPEPRSRPVQVPLRMRNVLLDVPLIPPWMKIGREGLLDQIRDPFRNFFLRLCQSLHAEFRGMHLRPTG
jgi:hypothetical protein